MKFSIATLFLATTGFVNAFPAADDIITIAAAPRSSCGDQAGRVTCSKPHGERYPHILVCVSKKWKIQASCAKGTSCNGNDQKSQAWCEAY